MKNLLLDYVRYNLWVNSRLVETFRQTANTLISQEIVSSFSSIRATLIHSAKGEFNQKASDMIHHCMNHQTFHRGQIITMARQLGLTEFPRTDFIIFKRENVS
jgi:uncharacterized damage-inducible protein DinB